MNLFAKKSLGQHFLNSPSVLTKIIDAAKIKPGEIVLEIGPGTGFLTRALLNTSAKVIAIEKDARAIDILKEKFADSIAWGTLTILNSDVLETDRTKLLPITVESGSTGDEAGLRDGGYALVANIPYYITGAILESFLEHAPRPNRMVLLVQREVAERIIARDGKESILSISVKAFGIPKLIATVPPDAFTPPPTVDSAILSISHISAARFTETGLEISRFFDILKTGFAHKRKFLKRNLEALIAPAILDTIWHSLALNGKVRAEDVEISKWLALSLVFKNQMNQPLM